jgi:hypothetical protein
MDNEKQSIDKLLRLIDGYFQRPSEKIDEKFEMQLREQLRNFEDIKNLEPEVVKKLRKFLHT